MSRNPKALKFKRTPLQKEEPHRAKTLWNVKFLKGFLSDETRTSEGEIIFYAGKWLRHMKTKNSADNVFNEITFYISRNCTSPEHRWTRVSNAFLLGARFSSQAGTLTIISLPITFFSNYFFTEKNPLCLNYKLRIFVYQYFSQADEDEYKLGLTHPFRTAALFSNK